MAINLRNPTHLLGIAVVVVLILVFIYKKQVCAGPVCFADTGVSKNEGSLVSITPPLDIRPTIDNPEGYIETIHNFGDALPITQHKEALTSDGVSVLTKESTVEQLCRSLWDADFDGPQMEGMTAPIQDFENAAMSMQNAKARELYVDYKSQTADMLSDANI